MAVTETEARPVPRSRSARIAHVGGSVLLAIGAIALIWAFVIWRWGDPATGLYTRWQQHQLRQDLAVVEQQFESVRTDVSQAPAPATLAVRRTEARKAAQHLSATTKEGDPVGRLRVSRLGLNMIVVDGTDHESLTRGPGVDRRTALPGEGALVYIAGHRTTYGAPFAHIDRLRRGDRVRLDMPYGKYVYRVTGSVIVPATDLARLRSRGREEIALQACHPRFSARERYIVYARPVSGPGLVPVN